MYHSTVWFIDIIASTTSVNLPNVHTRQVCLRYVVIFLGLVILPI